MFSSLMSPAQGKFVNATMRDLGCDSVAILQRANLNLCIPEQGGIGRSVRAFCPESCKKVLPTSCTVIDINECPIGCWDVGTPTRLPGTQEFQYLSISTGLSRGTVAMPKDQGPMALETTTTTSTT